MRQLLFILFISLLSFESIAQEGSGFDASRLRFGGNIGFSGGTNGTLFHISPNVGYFFTDKFIAGPGISYTHLKYKQPGVSTYQFTGAMLFGSYYALENFFLHSEAIQTQVKHVETGNTAMQTQLFIGGGYSFSRGAGIGRGTYIIVLYDILHNANSFNRLPYDIRIGFRF